MKKVVVFVITIVFCAVIFAAPALAAVVGTSMSIWLPGFYSNQDVYVINGATLYIHASGGASTTNMRIHCQQNSTVYLDNITIDVSSISGASGLSFDDGTGTLELVGTCAVIGGSGASGINVTNGATMNIAGTGTLTATGGNGGAGIGAKPGDSLGTIHIADREITAVGGVGGAGINGIVNISGASKVNATAGSGADGVTGTVAIKDTSEVMAIGGDGGAGLSGNVDIYNTSKVYAGTATGNGKDFDNTVTLHDRSILFLRNDTGVSPLTPDGHTHRTPASWYDPLIFHSNAVYDVNVDSTWVDARGVWYLFPEPPMAQMPVTGQNTSYLYWAAGLVAITLAGMVLVVRRHGKRAQK